MDKYSTWTLTHCHLYTSKSSLHWDIVVTVSSLRPPSSSAKSRWNSSCDVVPPCMSQYWQCHSSCVQDVSLSIQCVIYKPLSVLMYMANTWRILYALDVLYLLTPGGSSRASVSSVVSVIPLVYQWQWWDSSSVKIALWIAGAEGSLTPAFICSPLFASINLWQSSSSHCCRRRVMLWMSHREDETHSLTNLLIKCQMSIMDLL